MGRRIRAALLIFALAVGARAERWWVELPRAESVEALSDLGGAPAPSPRAIERRAARGDTRRMDFLSRGPSRERLRSLADEVDRIHFVSRWLSAASCELSPSQLAALRARGDVLGLSPVRSLRRDVDLELESARSEAQRPVPKTEGGLDYGLSAQQIAMIQVDRMHALGFSGQGIRILVLDTGFMLDVPALRHVEPVAAWDFVQGDGEVANQAGDLPRQHEHGTGVLGLLAGYDPGRLIGPAYAAEILLAKTEVEGSETRLEEDLFVAALEWGEALGIDLCTASLGYLSFDDGSSYGPEDLDGDTAVTTRAMDAIAAMGVVALSAAGNRGGLGGSTLLTPADGDSVIAVGSVRPDSLRSNFSSQGPTADGRIKPDVMARGTDTVWATVEGGYSTTVDGTSTATPQVAGVAALLLEAHPEWGPVQVADALRATATHARDPDNEYGYGIVRAHAAAFELQAPIVPLPFALIDPAVGALLDADRGARFRWRHAADLQTPDELVYELQLAADAEFSVLVQVADAGGDSSVTLPFLSTQARHWRVLARDPQTNLRLSPSRDLTVSSASDSPEAGSWAWFREPRPNPFRATVVLPIELRLAGRVDASLFDVRGRVVRRWTAIQSAPGLFALRWDGRDDDGDAVAAGNYWLRLRARSDAQSSEATFRLLRLP